MFTPFLHSGRLGLVALTALMTLVAGMPQLRCECIPGTTRALTFLQGTASACCCNNGCSDPSAPKSAKPSENLVPACCRHKHFSHGRGSSPLEFRSHSCHKTLLQGDVYAETERPTTPSDDVMAPMILSVPGGLDFSTLSAHVVVADPLPHPPSSSADLVTLLQRLTI